MVHMKIRMILIVFMAALLFLSGCGEEKDTSEKDGSAREQKAEQEFLERLAERPVTPPDYVGPEPKWWWLNPDSPPNYVGPEPGWWRKAPIPPACVGPIVESEPEEPETPKKKVQKAPAKPKAVVRKPPRRSAPKSQDEVHREFEIFAERFLDKMARNLRHTSLNKEVIKAGAGYVARFVRLDKTTLTVDVKPCEGPASYVGVMRYHEGHYENRCGTEDCAKDGPFKLVKKVRFTEIFRYAGGRWHE